MSSRHEIKPRLRGVLHSGAALAAIPATTLLVSCARVGTPTTLALIYGVMGTLSMADVAAKLPLVAADDRGLLHAGAAMLAVAFLVKAAIWPLNSWLVPVYSAASAPVAALFSLMTKLGIYTLLRLWTLFFSADAGPSAQFGAEVLRFAGLATVVFGILGLLATLRLGSIAGFSIVVSSGTLLVAIGIVLVTAKGEVRRQTSEAGGRRSEVRCPKSEIGTVNDASPMRH